MTRTTLYTGGGVSLSVEYADGRTESQYIRLSADEGKALKKGDVITPVIDVVLSDAGNWEEIEAPADDEDIEDSEALGILMGVNE